MFQDAAPATARAVTADVPMINHDILALLRCPACHHPELHVGSGRRPELVCEGCQARYPIVDGIIDMMPRQSAPEPGYYRTETLFNLIAGVYDLVAPVMSMGIWRCSPLRYIDSENRALGRANGGVYLAAPIGTGIVLDQVLTDYHDVTVIGVDQSWKMLRKAKQRLADHDQPVHLIRGTATNLPLRDDTVDSVQSVNGLHTFSDRKAAITEFIRCLHPDGFLSGTALVRGEQGIADRLLDRYERYGVYPLLRTPEFLTQELDGQRLEHLHYETHGAVMFYTAQASR